MKNLSLFWKIVLLVITLSVGSVLLIIGWKLYDQRCGIYLRQDDYNNCKIIRYKSWKERLFNLRIEEYTTLKLDWIAPFNKNDTTTVFAKDGKRGYLNRFTGKISIPAQYDRAWMFSEGMGGVLKNKKLGFINAKGEVAIPFQFPYDPNFDLEVDFLFKNGFCTANSSNGKFGVINKLGKWVITPEYDYITNPTKGFRVIRKGEMYGVIDSLCNWTMPLDYDWVKVTNEGFIVVKKDIQQLLAFDAKSVIQPFLYDQTDELHYNSLRSTNEGEDIMVCSEYISFSIHNKWGVMDKNGKVVIKARYSEIKALTNDLFSCQIGDYWITMNTKEQIIY